jgi:hypothetical protein
MALYFTVAPFYDPEIPIDIRLTPSKIVPCIASSSRTTAIEQKWIRMRYVENDRNQTLGQWLRFSLGQKECYPSK